MKKYAAYKQCDGDWLEEIPINWKICRGKYLFEIKKRIVGELGHDVLSITQNGVKIKDTESGDGQLSMDYSKYQIVNKGDFAMNHMDLLTGYVDISKHEGVTSPDYRVFSCIDEKECSKYFLYVLQMAYRNKVFFKYGKGASHLGRWRLPADEFKNFWFPCPSDKEKQQIVSYLDNQTQKLDVLTSQYDQLVQLFSEKMNSLTHEVVKLPSTRYHRLVEVVELLTCPIIRDDNKVYNTIGVYNRGRGLFHKPPIIGADLGDSTFYEIKEHDFILSGQFAWEGSVAIACHEDEGCVASHRFPILRAKNNLVESAYLFAFFRTGMGHFLLDQNSQGAAGRNRPLNIRTLMKEKIPIPPIEDQQRITSLVDMELKLRKTAYSISTTIKEKRAALIFAAVTGQIDVSNYKF